MRRPPDRLNLALLVAATAVGCGARADRSVVFVPTDPSFHRDDLDGEVQVFIDRTPDLPYRSVGIIEVRRHALQDAIDAAVAKAKAVGCDFVIDRKLHNSPQASLALPRWALAHDRRVQVASVVVIDRSPPVREFICGVVQL